jgi:hypothetical protein
MSLVWTGQRPESNAVRRMRANHSWFSSGNDSTPVTALRSSQRTEKG